MRPQKQKCKLCGASMPADRLKCSECGKIQIEEPQGDNDGTFLLSEGDAKKVPRIETGVCDLIFGGGLALASVNLIGGAPGAGKSTFSLQLSDSICGITGREVMYIATEEIRAAIRERAERLKLKFLSKIRIVPVKEGYAHNLSQAILARKPVAIILDSLPGMTGENDERSVELINNLKDHAIELMAPIVVIDHVTKADDFAGRMTLQHAVDGLFTLFTRNPHGGAERVMRVRKNRNGSDAVELCLQMTESGLIECQGCTYCEPDELDEAIDTDEDD
jgi:DNA repair protein RadA/Sms